ncbi:hypothetical protein [Palaeococcus sp. (in: euryarchaeotes)]
MFGKDTDLSIDEVIKELIDAHWDLQSLRAQLMIWDGLEAGYLKVAKFENGKVRWVGINELSNEGKAHLKRANFYELWLKEHGLL